jgi:hypothetical protein
MWRRTGAYERGKTMRAMISGATLLPALLAGGSAAAQTAPPPPPAHVCTAPENHTFDFWVGHWDVYNPAGKLVAHSLIESVYDGCGIRENWMPLYGGPGGSLSTYIPASKQWEQFWIDSTNASVHFTGGWNGHAMVIQGVWAGPIVRMTYSSNPDGSVRQLGESSKDDGKTWTKTFDLTYRHAVG